MNEIEEATNAVFEELQKEDGMYHVVGEKFSTEDLAGYIELASRWLKDQSELTTWEIREANWEEIYNYFKST
ncbi:hypothetical protein [Amycolatopsis sp. lyj-112]|uniref:hypothetical protein n=1 Tax=Amycolatopsis sp. lyj-112 TaxID=2789288 RepID=UPI00397D47CE